MIDTQNDGSLIIRNGWLVYLVAVLAFIIFLYLKPWLRAVYLAFNLPGPPALPLLGNVLMLGNNTSLINFGKRACNDYGSIFRSWISIIPFIVVLEPKYIQTILGSSRFTDKNFLYSLMHTFVGEGLITNNGHKWKSHRKYIQPYFHLNVLEMFVQTFIQGANSLVEELRGKDLVQITNYVNTCVLDMLHEAILGIPMKDKELKKQSPFSKGQITLFNRILRPWLLFDFTYKLTTTSKSDFEQKSTLQKFSKHVMEQRQLNGRSGAGPACCLLEILMEISENNPDFTEDDIVNEVSTFMLAGQDSVSAAICFTLYYIAKHQDVQERIMEELDAVFLRSDSINMEILNEMKYLEQCIKEAMRLCPSVPLIARKLYEDVQLGKHILPAGCNVFITPFCTHRLPQYYPDPEKYNPDRFSSKNTDKSNPFAYLTFSGGPRNCIGYKFALLEMKTVIATLLKNYKLSLKPGYDLELLFRITLRAKGGVWLKLEPRTNTLETS